MFAQKATLGSMGCCPRVDPIPYSHRVSEGYHSEAWAAGGRMRPSLPWCFGSACFEAWRQSFGASFVLAHKATLGIIGCKRQAGSILHWHGVSG